MSSKLDAIHDSRHGRGQSDNVGHRPNADLKASTWERIYSKGRAGYFWFDRETMKVQWECEAAKARNKAGEPWERYNVPDASAANNGGMTWFYLDPLTGHTQLGAPENHSMADAFTAFDPGEFTPAIKIKKGSKEEKERRRSSVLSPMHMLHDEEEVVIPFCMVDPSSSQRLMWDFSVIMPCLMYLTIMMPYRLCFNHSAKNRMLVLETAMDLLFLIDICINFRTGYFVTATGLVEYDFRKVADRYLRSWLCLDVVSAIPFGLFDMPLFSNFSFVKILKSSRIIKAVKLLRFLKLMRLLKTTKLLMGLDRETLDRIEDLLHDVSTRSVFSMARILGGIGIACHFMACFWVLIGREGDKRGANNWLNNDVWWKKDPSGNGGVGFTFRDTEGGPLTRAVYISAYYFCFTTITSVGYGDIHPYNTSERLYGIILEAVGGVLYAIIIAALTSIVTSTDSNKRVVTERLDMVSSYISSRRFPEELGRRVRRYFRHFYENKTAIDEQRILSDLPTSLRHEVSSFLVAGLMSNVMLFRDLSPVLWAQILPLLRPCRFELGDVVSKQDEECVEAFILLEGEARGMTVYDPDNFEARAARLRMPAAVTNSLDHRNSQHKLEVQSLNLMQQSQLLFNDSLPDKELGRGGSLVGVKNIYDGIAERFLSPQSRRQRLSPITNSFQASNEATDRGEGRVLQEAAANFSTTADISAESSAEPPVTSQPSPLSSSSTNAAWKNPSVALDLKQNTAKQGRKHPHGRGGAAAVSPDNTATQTVTGLESSIGQQQGGVEQSSDRRGSDRSSDQGRVEDPNVHARSLLAGDMMDVLCILRVWDRSVETVVCSDLTEFYAIHSEEFRRIFDDHKMLYQEMREQVVLTTFCMYRDPGPMGHSGEGGGGGGAHEATGGQLPHVAGIEPHHCGIGEYGVPMYMYNREESEFRTEAYEAQKQVQAEAYVAAVRKNERDERNSKALTRTFATNKAAVMFKARSRLAMIKRASLAAGGDGSSSDLAESAEMSGQGEEGSTGFGL